jgi:hypothetical protein
MIAARSGTIVSTERRAQVLERRGRTLVRSGLALAGLVGVVVLLPQLTARLSRQAGPVAPEGGRGHIVRDVRTIADFRGAFNEDAGHVRLVLLLSPT